jgi:hypothetical protein
MRMSNKIKKWTDFFLDPMWQKKRLEIMQRDEITCQGCGDMGKTLNVHHTYYDDDKFIPPWDYPDDTLITFCEDCHTQEHIQLKEYEKNILYCLKKCGLTSQDISNLAFYICNQRFYIPKKSILNALNVFLCDAKLQKEALEVHHQIEEIQNLCGEEFDNAVLNHQRERGTIDE